MLKINGCDGKHFVQRRYPCFARMSDALRQHCSLPEMPPKSVFRCRFSPTFREERVLALGQLVSAAVAADPFATHPALRTFLGLSNVEAGQGLRRAAVLHAESGLCSLDSSLDSIAETAENEIQAPLAEVICQSATPESVIRAREVVVDAAALFEVAEVLPHLAEGDAAMEGRLLADEVPPDAVVAQPPMLKAMSTLRVARVATASPALFTMPKCNIFQLKATLVKHHSTLKFNLSKKMKFMLSMLFLLFQALDLHRGTFNLRWVQVLERLSSLVC